MLRAPSIPLVAVLVAAVHVIAVGMAMSDVAAAPRPRHEGAVVASTIPPALALAPPAPLPAADPPTAPPPLPPPPAVPQPTPAPVVTPTPEVAAPERVAAAFDEAVPEAWRAAIPVSLHIIEGNTSWAHGSGDIDVGRVHAEGPWAHLLSVLAHEFGHLVAFELGTGEYAGAPPAGWPDPGYGDPAEAWADCVGQAFTGSADPSYGMPPCPSASLDWTAWWLTTVPI